MLFESGLVGFLREIVGKVHIDNILPQIAHIVHVKDVGVFFAVLLCIHLRQFDFSDTGDAMEEHLAVIHQQFVKLHLFPANKPAAWLRYIAVKDEVLDRRRQVARCQMLFGPYIPLFKTQLHGKTEDVSDKHRFVVFILEGESV